MKNRSFLPLQSFVALSFIFTPLMLWAAGGQVADEEIQLWDDIMRLENRSWKESDFDLRAAAALQRARASEAWEERRLQQEAQYAVREATEKEKKNNLNKFRDSEKRAIEAGKFRGQQLEKLNFSPEDAMNPALVGISAQFIRVAPQAPYEINYDFEMQATEMIQLQSFIVTQSVPSTFKIRNRCDADSYVQLSNGTEFCAYQPVESITYEEVEKFIDRLNASQKQYYYRLPSEAEWLYAASMEDKGEGWNPSNSTTSADPTLDDWNSPIYSKVQRTHRVAQLKPNALGFYDLMGNVAEFVYKQERISDRFVRGYHHLLIGERALALGSTFYSDNQRAGILLNERSNGIGFRLVRRKL